ncbi:3'-5' exonuclease [Rhodoferax sp. OV413]|uniref:3'-5' exonuclease n=1 Tax=Rhodoferax sp. OV413 TaxID=1855285 RepID=UPI00087E33F7|nr:3'-5' exonuclease [Rhodoferax sp. OV413]SDP67790.1 3'-5' exonuclease [Rhodoferax sp. OV413]
MKLIAPSKADTALLPPFPGLPLERILVPSTAAEFAAATADILAAGAVGFDTEAKPTFAPGEVSSGPHVVQFALRDKAYIFQLHWPDCRACLVQVLESEQVRKVGFGLEQDRGQLHARLDVTLRAVMDLNLVFRKQGYGSSMGVRAAVGVVLRQRFHKSKKTTTSNWAQPTLTPTQLLYAANDAYAALKVFEAL